MKKSLIVFFVLLNLSKQIQNELYEKGDRQKTENMFMHKIFSN